MNAQTHHDWWWDVVSQDASSGARKAARAARLAARMGRPIGPSEAMRIVWRVGVVARALTRAA